MMMINVDRMEFEYYNCSETVKMAGLSKTAALCEVGGGLGSELPTSLGEKDSAPFLTMKEIWEDFKTL